MVVFVDSNVPMYMVGEPHPNKDRTLFLVRQLVDEGESMVTDVEVYQELLHRYSAIHRLDSLDDALRTLDSIADEALTFEIPEIRLARGLIESVQGISARDAIHVAVMHGAGINRIFSFDRGFDNCPGIVRFE